MDKTRPGFAVIEEAFARASGASLVTGNDVRLLRDARENYPAWLEAIAAARRTIHFESYIIHDDETGREFARTLEARARRGCGYASSTTGSERWARPPTGSGASFAREAWRSAASTRRAC